MSAALGIQRFGVVLNKSVEPDDAAWIESEFGPGALLSTIPFDSRIARADRQHLSVADLGEPKLLIPFQLLERNLKEKTR